VPLQAGNELIVVIRGRAGTRLSLAVSGGSKRAVIGLSRAGDGSPGRWGRSLARFSIRFPQTTTSRSRRDAQAAVIRGECIAGHGESARGSPRRARSRSSIPAARRRARRCTLLPLNARFTATRAGLNAPLTRLSTPSRRSWRAPTRRQLHLRPCHVATKVGRSATTTALVPGDCGDQRCRPVHVSRHVRRRLGAGGTPGSRRTTRATSPPARGPAARATDERGELRLLRRVVTRTSATGAPVTCSTSPVPARRAVRRPRPRCS